MKFSIERSELLKALQLLSSVVPVKNTMPILENFLIKVDQESKMLTIIASDIELTVISELNANVIIGGEVCVQARKFADIINSFPDEIVNFEKEEDFLRIWCMNSKFNILCADTSQYPEIPESKMENSIESNAIVFREMITKTSFAVSGDRGRAVFTGVFWKVTPDYQLMAATDGKKIAEYKIEEKINISATKEKIIPVKNVHFLEKIINENSDTLVYDISDKKVIFKYENYTIFFKFMKGTYPDYSKVFPENLSNKLSVSREELKKSINRVALVSSESSFRVEFELTSDMLKLSSSNREFGEANDILPSVVYEGEDLRIAFNYKFFVQIINSVSVSDLEVFFGASQQPILISDKIKDNITSRYLLMPLRMM